MSNKKHRVFVYGTLRRAGAATHELRGHTLHLIKASNFPFPSIKRTSDYGKRVLGNIIEVDDTELEELDSYEGVDDGLYTREVVVVHPLGSSDTVTAFAYYGSDQLFPPVIESGDWHSR